MPTPPHALDALVAWLGRATNPERLGGKGASLDRLARMGYRVPVGFCLTTAAFRLQLSSVPSLGRLLERLTNDGDLTAGAQLAAELATAPLEPAIDGALADALAQLRPGVRLAVRSSAIGEDGSEASYAGLHETELDLPIDEVAAATRRCWASLWSAPALAYRRRRGLPLDGAAMAVVVQELVPADAAAVAFTRHPVTGRDDQLVITAAHGLGEAMVSGTVTPDTYVVDRASRRVIELTPGDGLVRPLDDEGLDGLVDLVLGVEAGFGAAVDVEAAIAGGTWFLLQARPITTGTPASAAARRAS